MSEEFEVDMVNTKIDEVNIAQYGEQGYPTQGP